MVLHRDTNHHDLKVAVGVGVRGDGVHEQHGGKGGEKGGRQA